MTYLSVHRFWDYQNKDVWKKSKGHPPWFKFYVHRDRALDDLPPLARLLFYELLGAASRNSNVLKADLNWLYAETRIEPEVIAEMLPLLLKGRWLSQTDTPRRSRMPSRKNRDDSRALIEEEVEEEVIPPIPPSGKRLRSMEALVRATAHEYTDASLTDELWRQGADEVTIARLLRLAQEIREAA